jgi:hypothetical protein
LIIKSTLNSKIANDPKLSVAISGIWSPIKRPVNCKQGAFFLSPFLLKFYGCGVRIPLADLGTPISRLALQKP